jgi:hypothetical protein
MRIKYILKDAGKLRQRLAREKDWQSNRDIAAGAGLTYQYISRIFKPAPVGHRAMKQLADAVGAGMLDIAKFATNEEKK